MSSPLVSVIVPTFNRCRFLGDAVRSALNQTERDLEVIVVDDGSLDETPPLLDRLRAEDSRVRAFRQDNAGVSAARNRAIGEARGSFIAFLDSDDVWKPWKLELQLALLRACPDLGMVWTNMDAITPAGEIWQESFLKHMYGAYHRLPNQTPFTNWQTLGNLVDLEDGTLAETPVGSGDIYREMFLGNLVHTPTVLVRRDWVDKVGHFDTSMRRGGEDYKFHLATCRLGPVGYLGISSILYRTGIGDHITNRENNLHFARSFMRTLQEELAQERARDIFDCTEVAGILATAHEWLAEESCASNLRREAIQHALRTIYLKRRLGKTWKVIVKSLLPRRLAGWISQKKSQWRAQQVQASQSPLKSLNPTVTQQHVVTQQSALTCNHLPAQSV